MNLNQQQQQAAITSNTSSSTSGNNRKYKTETVLVAVEVVQPPDSISRTILTEMNNGESESQQQQQDEIRTRDDHLNLDAIQIDTLHHQSSEVIGDVNQQQETANNEQSDERTSRRSKSVINFYLKKINNR